MKNETTIVRRASPLQRTFPGVSWHQASYRLIEQRQWRALIRHVAGDIRASLAALFRELGELEPPEDLQTVDLVEWLDHPPATRPLAEILLYAHRWGFLNQWERNRLLEALELLDRCRRGSGDPQSIAQQALALFVAGELAAAVVRKQVQR